MRKFVFRLLILIFAFTFFGCIETVPTGSCRFVNKTGLIGYGGTDIKIKTNGNKKEFTLTPNESEVVEGPEKECFIWSFEPSTNTKIYTTHNGNTITFSSKL